MTQGSAAQIKELIIKLQKKSKAGCHSFHVQSSLDGAMQIGYLNSKKEHLLEEVEFSKSDVEQAFLDITDAIHRFNRILQ